MPSNSPLSSLAALKALIEAGASDKLLAQAARELVARELIQRDLTEQPGLPSEVEAPGIAVESRAQAPRSTAPAKLAGTALPGKAAKPEHVMFRDSSGARSSINIKPSTWAELTALAPKDFDLKGRARDLAASAPDGVQRSAYVCEQLRALLKKASA